MLRAQVPAGKRAGIYRVAWRSRRTAPSPSPGPPTFLGVSAVCLQHADGYAYRLDTDNQKGEVAQILCRLKATVPLAQLPMANYQANKKQLISQHFDGIAAKRPGWFKHNWLYHARVVQVCKPFLNPDSRVLEVGCSTGDLINAINPAAGVGIDLSDASIAIARQHYPRYQWIHADAETLSYSEPLDQPS